MKSLILCISAVILCMSSLTVAQPVVFNDANLKALVEAELGMTDPTADDMLDLTSLNAGSRGISDLTGLETATNLTWINMGNNQVIDLSPLTGLTNLTWLGLSKNQISDISALDGLANLTELYLVDNQIGDISALSGLTNLTILSLSENQFSDISALSGLTNLTTLDMNGNLIRNLSALSGLTNLTQLSIANNNHQLDSHLQLSDISALAGLTKLTVLSLNGNDRISDISALAGLTELTDLNLSSNQISDISGLSGLTNLTALSLGANQISDTTALSGLTHLTVLDLTNNQVDDISALSGLTKLTGVYLEINQISDISALSQLTELTSLFLRGNPLDQAACDTDLPLILQNNPGLTTFQIDPEFEACALANTLQVSSTAGGSVTTPGEGNIDLGYGTADIDIIAEPMPNFRFLNWSGDAVTAGLVADPCAATTTVTFKGSFQLQANFESLSDALYVDDDLPGSSEDGSYEHPIASIQSAIEVARHQSTIFVNEGYYTETIDFLGKDIVVTSEDPDWPDIFYFPTIDGNDLGTVVTFTSGEPDTAALRGFVITRGLGQDASAVACRGTRPTIANCVIAGNRATDRRSGAVRCVDANAVFLNCTIADNASGTQGAGMTLINSNVTLANCILWQNLPNDFLLNAKSNPIVTYTNTTTLRPGVGNTDYFPDFYLPGYWANPDDISIAMDPTDPLAVWVEGDYHLVSEHGRWDPRQGTWVQDIGSSACIDAGDPTSPADYEPGTNGGRINQGAYGGTDQASQSPPN